MHLFTLQPSCGFCCLLLWYFDMMDQPTTALPLATLLWIKMLPFMCADHRCSWVLVLVPSQCVEVSIVQYNRENSIDPDNYESLSFHTASHRFGYLPDRWGTGKKLFFSSDWLLILPLGGRQEGRWRRRQSRQCSGVQVLGLVANTAARWPPAPVSRNNQLV